MAEGRIPKRGIFLAQDLATGELQHEFPELDAQCVIRFPKAVAQVLAQRMEDNLPLGLTITPTVDEDFRIYDIQLELDGSDTALKLKGVLVELPCVVETYKTLCGEVIYKSGDVSQIIIVYEFATEIDWKKLKETDAWEWETGLTPATNKIRARKFRNVNLFNREFIQATEREILKAQDSTMTMAYQDVVRKSDMEADRIRWEAKKTDSSETWERNVTYVFPDDPTFEDDDLDSNLSDILMNLSVPDANEAASDDDIIEELVIRRTEELKRKSEKKKRSRKRGSGSGGSGVSAASPLSKLDDYF